MKRFYCTICQRVKRVRHYPADIETPFSEKPLDRTGKCDFHTRGRVKLQPKVRAFKTLQSTVKVTTSARKSKRAS